MAGRQSCGLGERTVVVVGTVEVRREMEIRRGWRQNGFGGSW